MNNNHENDNNENLGFTYQARKQGEVLIYHHGRLATTLRGESAMEFIAFLDECEGSDFAAQQQLMARITGNYKHGNERTAMNHSRNRGK
jgi:hypothetical protein